MRFILDFDRVIFNVNAYKSALAERDLEALKFDPAVWEQLTVSDFLYDDVQPFIAQVGREQVYILSAITPEYNEKAPAFQRRKVEGSGMAAWVAGVQVMRGDKGPYVAKLAAEQPAVFVDDKLSHLESVRTLAPQVFCVQMIRPGGAPEGENKSDREDVPIVTSFAAVSTMLNELNLV